MYKPRSILHHHKTSKTKLDSLHYHDKDIKEIEEIKFKTAFSHAATKHEAIRSAPHKQMPKEDPDDPIDMVF